MRLFVAVPIPEATTRELVAEVKRIQSEPYAQQLRWSRPAGWHITLHFLGDTSPGAFDCLTRALDGFRAKAPAITAGGPGVFERAGVVYAGVELGAGLMALQQSVIRATSNCGFTPESRPYTPHITLAKTRSRSAMTALAGDFRRKARPLTFSTFRAHEICLYESTPGSAGEYVVRQRIALEG